MVRFVQFRKWILEKEYNWKTSKARQQRLLENSALEPWLLDMIGYLLMGLSVISPFWAFRRLLEAEDHLHDGFQSVRWSQRVHDIQMNILNKNISVVFLIKDPKNWTLYMKLKTDNLHFRQCRLQQQDLRFGLLQEDPYDECFRGKWRHLGYWQSNYSNDKWKRCFCSRGTLDDSLRPQ